MWLKKLYDDKLGGLTGRQLLLKVLVGFFGSAVTALGVGLFIASSLGSDPVSVWLDGLDHTFHFGIGTASMINNCTTLCIALLFCFKYINIGTVISSVFFSQALGWFHPLLQDFLAAHPGLVTQAGMIAVGMVLMAAGCAFTVSLRFGFSSTDSILFRILDFHPRWQYRYIKICSDGVFITAGFLLGGVIGVGTVVGFVLTGPAISFFVPIIDRWLLRPLGIDDPHNQQMQKKAAQEETDKVAAP